MNPADTRGQDLNRVWVWRYQRLIEKETWITGSGPGNGQRRAKGIYGITGAVRT